MHILSPQARSANLTASHNGLEETSHYMYAIIYPIIFIFGLIGNLLSSLLFSITKLNLTSCGVYFLLLAVYDSLALIGGLHHCLTIGFRIPVPNATYCRARNFFLYTSLDMTSWMIVAISVDRYLKVKFPIKSRIYCTRRLAIIVACILTGVFIGKNVHLATPFIGDFSDDAADQCDPNPAYPNYKWFFETIWPWIDLTTFALLPFIIISICNGFIIHDQYKRRVKLRKRHLDLSLISLLLVSSISFVVCNLPFSVLGIMYPYISTTYDNNIDYDGAAFAFDLLRLPLYASLALNFYLYYYTSTLFRQQTLVLFRRIFRSKPKINDFEMPSRIYTDPNEQNRFSQRLNSIEDSSEPQPPPPKLPGSSFVSDFFSKI